MPPVSDPISALKLNVIVVLVVAVNVKRPGRVGTMPVLAYTYGSVQSDSSTKLLTLMRTL